MTDELRFIEQVLRRSGELALQFFVKGVRSRRKEEKSQIVTDADIAVEKLIVEAIKDQYTESSIIAEESGFLQKDQDDTWIIDPIDGTSNFANNLPWFGVMIARLHKTEVVSSGIYLPVSGELYLASRGHGVVKNGKQFFVRKGENLSDVLVGFGTDGSEKSVPIQTKGKMYAALLPRVLNVRTTNSAVDYVYAAEGKIGGLINLENKIWDIAPISLIAKEALCSVTDVEGKDLRFHVATSVLTENFTLLMAHPLLHKKLLSLLRSIV